MPAFESFPRPDCQLAEQWDPLLFIPSLNLSQSCLDKHGCRQMNSQSLCSAPLASFAILWSSYWDHSSAPSHPLSALGDWQSVTDPLPPTPHRQTQPSLTLLRERFQLIYLSSKEMKPHYQEPSAGVCKCPSHFGTS